MSSASPIRKTRAAYFISHFWLLSSSIISLLSLSLSLFLSFSLSLFPLFLSFSLSLFLSFSLSLFLSFSLSLFLSFSLSLFFSLSFLLSFFFLYFTPLSPSLVYLSSSLSSNTFEKANSFNSGWKLEKLDLAEEIWYFAWKK